MRIKIFKQRINKNNSISGYLNYITFNKPFGRSHHHKMATWVERFFVWLKHSCWIRFYRLSIPISPFYNHHVISMPSNQQTILLLHPCPCISVINITYQEWFITLKKSKVFAAKGQNKIAEKKEDMPNSRSSKISNKSNMIWS